MPSCKDGGAISKAMASDGKLLIVGEAGDGRVAFVVAHGVTSVVASPSPRGGHRDRWEACVWGAAARGAAAGVAPANNAFGIGTPELSTSACCTAAITSPSAYGGLPPSVLAISRRIPSYRDTLGHSLSVPLFLGLAGDRRCG
jgi:hypothetical protein